VDGHHELELADRHAGWAQSVFIFAGQQAAGSTDGCAETAHWGRT
jgi:hypothetical protein